MGSVLFKSNVDRWDARSESGLLDAVAITGGDAILQPRRER